MTIKSKEACPKCREEGKDKAGDNLAVYEDGGGFCFSCGYTTQKFDTTAKSEAQTKGKLTISQVLTYPKGMNPGRSIHPQIYELYNTRVSHCGETGGVDTVYYLYANESGDITNYKRRKLGTKDFSTGGKLPGFYGKNVCKGTDYLIITEGEEDCHAVRQLLDMSKGLKPLKIDVVSLPNGAQRKTDRTPRIEEEVLAELDWIEQYKRVYLCFDNDHPGQHWAEVIADWLCRAIEVRILDVPRPHKDANDLLAKEDPRVFRVMLNESKPYEPEGVVSGNDISLDDLLEPIPEGYKIPYPTLQDKLLGIRKGEIVTICAASGIGKSTFMREIMYALTEQGAAIANIALEDQMNVAAQAMVALDMNIPLARFRFHPPDKAATEASYKKMVANDRTYFYKHFGGLTCDSLISRLEYYVRSKKVDIIALDHLSMVVSASETSNERKEIDTLMTKLAQLVTETGVGLMQIVHLKRVGTRDGKSFAKGGEVELTDLRGSAALEQLSWAVIALERDQQGEDSDFIQVRLLKNRTASYTGPAGLLKYDTLTGRTRSAESDLTPLKPDTTEVLDDDSLGT